MQVEFEVFLIEVSCFVQDGSPDICPFPFRQLCFPPLLASTSSSHPPVPAGWLLASVTPLMIICGDPQANLADPMRTHNLSPRVRRVLG